MANILLIYSTTDGHTLKISKRLQQVIERLDNKVTLVDIKEANTIDPRSFDKIFIGASIRYGKHSPETYAFIKQHQQTLENRPSAFFSVNVVARKPHKQQPNTNPYVRKFLKQIPWKPKTVAVFAGRIDYQRYSFWDRNIIRMIMWITKGPTDPDTDIEFTDWHQVDEFGRLIARLE